MIAHCTKCDHEWEYTTEIGICDWCGAEGREMYEWGSKEPEL